MPRITFTEDVTLANEPEGSGPHYRRGYCPDVSEDEARKWVKAGKAVMGVVQTPPVVEEKPIEMPAFRRKKRWQEE